MSNPENQHTALLQANKVRSRVAQLKAIIIYNVVGGMDLIPKENQDMV